MHEYAVTKYVLETVISEAEKFNISKITVVNIVIGDLSTFIDESIQMYFDILSENTPASGASLRFKRVPAKFKCNFCNKLFIKPKIGFDCPDCGNMGSITDFGKEFYIDSIEGE